MSSDLLRLIEEDTGAKSDESPAFFEYCPVCREPHPFRYFQHSDEWQCMKTKEVGSYGSYIQRTGRIPSINVAKDAKDGLVRDLIQETEQNDAWLREAREQRERDEIGDDFPPITRAKTTNPPPLAPVLIEGILREGHTLLVTSRSKAGKTCLMLELAVAVGTGGMWLGRKCERGRVLFINPETDEASMETRLREVAEAMSADPQEVEEAVDFWHLRGYVQGITDTTKVLLRRVGSSVYKLVALDSLYELYEGNENDAGDARSFFHQIDAISKATGAAVAMTHHHAKGDRSGYVALDRGSGSGVFGRKPDAPIDLSEIFPPSGEAARELPEKASAWRVSTSGLREFPSFEDFEVLFLYPVHVPDKGGIARDWKGGSPQQRGGQTTGSINRQKSEDRAERCVEALLSVIDRYEHGIPAKEAAGICTKVLGESITTQTLKRYVEKSDKLRPVQVSRQRWVVAKREIDRHGYYY